LVGFTWHHCLVTKQYDLSGDQGKGSRACATHLGSPVVDVGRNETAQDAFGDLLLKKHLPKVELNNRVAAGQLRNDYLNHKRNH